MTGALSRATRAIAGSVFLLAACRSTATRDPRAESGPRLAGSPSAEPTPAPKKAASTAPVVLDPSVYGSSSEPSTRSAPVVAASAVPKARRIYRVAAMGDSLTDPRSHGGKYLELLSKQCPESRFESKAKGGEMVNQMRRRFARDVLDAPAAAGEPPFTDVIVFGGVNDLYSDLTAGRTPEKVESDLEEMYLSAHSHGLRVVAITVAPWGGFRRYFNESRGKATERVNAWIREQPLAGTVDVVVDAYALLSCDGGAALCPEFAGPFNDGIHFGPAGHERLGKALFEAAFRDCR